MRPCAALLFVLLLAIVPEGFAYAQQAPQKAPTASAPLSGASWTHGAWTHGRNRMHHFRRHNRPPWWAPTVIVDPSMVQQILAWPTPLPPGGTNTVNPGGQVFKSISN